MNIRDQTPDPREDEDAVAFFRERASESGFTNLFDWFVSRRETDDMEELLIACHAHVIELIDEITQDESPVDEGTQFFRKHAREIGFDKLMSLFLHGSRRECVEGNMFAAESYINELIEAIPPRGEIDRNN